MKVLFLLILTVIICRAHVHAQAKDAVDPIEHDYRACVGTDTSVTTICNCAFKAYGRWNDQMELYYKRLMKELENQKEKQIAEKAQNAWKTWRDTEFGEYNCIFDKNGSKWNKVRAEGRLSMMRERAHQLKAYYEVLRNSKE
jgi:uncharacterized protein YecT (DUF1311 family)